jgi:hypothetical protein
LNDEINLAVFDPQGAQRLREDFERDLAGSREVNIEEWRRRPLLERRQEPLGRSPAGAVTVRLRRVAYNVHKCRGLDRRVSPDRILAVLTAIGADVIALQEVLSQPGRGRKSPPLRRRVLYSPGSRPQVFNVHLGTGFFERRRQARTLLHQLCKHRGAAAPRVILGDFNAWTRGLTSRLLARNLRAADVRVHLNWRRTTPACSRSCTWITSTATPPSNCSPPEITSLES